MKYTINHTEQGKILGFTKGDTDLNIEVSNAIWFEAQSFNKIIIDGENISFDKIDWRTIEEIRKEEVNTQTQEAKAYLTDTGWIWEKYNRNVLVLKDMTAEEFYTKYLEIITKQEECRTLINELEDELSNL